MGVGLTKICRLIAFCPGFHGGRCVRALSARPARRAKMHRQRLEAAQDERGAMPKCLTGTARRRSGARRNERADRDLALQSCQRCSQTKMHTLSKRQMAVRITLESSDRAGRTVARRGWPNQSRRIPSRRVGWSLLQTRPPRGRTVRLPVGRGSRSGEVLQRPA